MFSRRKKIYTEIVSLLRTLAPTLTSEQESKISQNLTVKTVLEQLINAKFTIQDEKTYLYLLSLLSSNNQQIEDNLLKGTQYFAAEEETEQNQSLPVLFSFLTFLELTAKLNMCTAYVSSTCAIMFSNPKRYPLDAAIEFFHKQIKNLNLSESKGNIAATDLLITMMPTATPNIVYKTLQKKIPTSVATIIMTYLHDNAESFNEKCLPTLKNSDGCTTTLRRK